MKTIDSAIYVASPNTITKRHYSPLLGVILTAVAVAALWANANVGWFALHELAAQWNMLLSSCLLCVGISMICYSLFGDSSAPIEKKTHERLYRTEFAFESADYARAKAAFEAGDFVRLRSMPRSYQAAVQVICYRTDSGSLAAAQLLRQQQPESDIRIFHEGEYAF
ncbi:MAG: hypothetical protein RRZ83_05800 [Alistipes sp.]